MEAKRQRVDLGAVINAAPTRKGPALWECAGLALIGFACGVVAAALLINGV